METAIAATKGTVDLVKVDILNIFNGDELTALGIKIISRFDPQDAPVVYCLHYEAWEDPG